MLEAVKALTWALEVLTMEWWVWLVIILAVLALLTFSTLGVQARRRSGTVIASGRKSRGKRGGQG